MGTWCAHLLLAVFRGAQGKDCDVICVADSARQPQAVTEDDDLDAQAVSAVHHCFVLISAASSRLQMGSRLLAVHRS